MIADLTPDENSIQMVAFMQVCDGQAAGTLSIPHDVAYGTGTLSGTFDVAIGSAPLTAVGHQFPGPCQSPVGFVRIHIHFSPTVQSTDAITGATYTSLVGPDDEVYKGVPKVMSFEIPVPEDYFGDLTLELTNLAYASDVFVDFCGIAVVGVGENLPCLDPVEDVTVSNGDFKTVDE